MEQCLASILVVCVEIINEVKQETKGRTVINIPSHNWMRLNLTTKEVFDRGARTIGGVHYYTSFG